jgi:hypothetical protein
MLVGMALVPAVSAQEELTVSDKPSELQQGLIAALNSNTKMPVDEIVSNYCKANKDIISKNSFVSDNSSVYRLKDGSNITFTNEGYIVIGSLKEEANNKTMQPDNEKGEVNSMSLVDPVYTDTITYSVSWYNYLGGKIFTVYTKGYFGYDFISVEPHHVDSWYQKHIIFNPWQVSDWQEGGQTTSSTTAEVYGSGRFSWGYTIANNYFAIQDKYIKVYITCNKFGQTSGGWIDN